MNTCRTCLTPRAEKDIKELENEVDEDNKDCLDVMLFCLDIKVEQDAKITTNLCTDCFIRIISFYKFKAQSLKNDAYLKSLSLDPVVHLDQNLSVDESGIKQENELDFEEFNPSLVEDYDTENFEVDLKNEDILGNIESDDETLSVVQKIKYEYIEETKENALICNRRSPIKKEYSVTKKENEPQKKEHQSSKKANAPRKKVRSRKKAKTGDEKQEQQMCDECGKYVYNVKEHSIRHQPKYERQMLQCKACPKLFFTKGGRHKHYRVSHLGRKSKCDICNKEVIGLTVHKLSMHNREALRFGCVLCERRYISQSALDFHMTTHTKVLPFECDLCHTKFRCKSRLSRHIRGVHEKERKYRCHLCPKAFFLKTRLETHIRSHTNERPYKCEECGKAFMDKKTLVNHQLLHSDVKQYRCPVCDMTFHRISYLNNHMISHTKEKKHPCQYCGARFGRSDHRRRHEFTAHQKYFTKGKKKK